MAWNYGVFILFISISALSAAFGAAIPKFGPYKIIPTALSKCEDGGTNQYVCPTKMYKRKGLPPYMNGTMIVGLPVDENYSINIEFAAWGNQGYRRRFMHHTFKGCEELMKYGGGFIKRFYASGGIIVDKCPLPAAELHLNGTAADISSTLIKTMPYNKYKGIFTHFYNGVKIGCAIYYADVVPLEEQ